MVPAEMSPPQCPARGGGNTHSCAPAHPGQSSVVYHTAKYEFKSFIQAATNGHWRLVASFFILCMFIHYLFIQQTHTIDL